MEEKSKDSPSLLMLFFSRFNEREVSYFRLINADERKIIPCSFTPLYSSCKCKEVRLFNIGSDSERDLIPKLRMEFSSNSNERN